MPRPGIRFAAGAVETFLEGGGSLWVGASDTDFPRVACDLIPLWSEVVSGSCALKESCGLEWLF